MADSQKMVLAGLGAAGIAAAIYCLTKETKTNIKKTSLVQESKGAPAGGKTKVEDISKETVSTILKEIIDSQEKMKSYMKTLTKELKTKQMDFEQTYDRVRQVQPDDPLEKYGLSMMEFDRLLDKYQSDPVVREAIAKIMGAPNPANTQSAKVQEITVKEIIAVHKFMLEELEQLVKIYQGLQNKTTGGRELDMKTVTIVAQAMVGAKMEEKFNIASEDLESAVLLYHTMLATDQEFAGINQQIQHTMGKLMGNAFPAAEIAQS